MLDLILYVLMALLVYIFDKLIIIIKMGQLTSKNEENWLKELNNEHTLLKTINDARYGEGKLYGNKVSPNQQVVHKDISVSDGQHYTLWKQKLQERQNLKHPNLIELKCIVCI